MIARYDRKYTRLRRGFSPLLEALADPDGGVRQLAAATLVKIGPDAVAPLVEALKSKDRETRANAAYVLGHLGEQAPAALPGLAKTLKDEDKEVRRRRPTPFTTSSCAAKPPLPPAQERMALRLAQAWARRRPAWPQSE